MLPCYPFCPSYNFDVKSLQFVDLDVLFLSFFGKSNVDKNYRAFLPESIETAEHRRNRRREEQWTMSGMLCLNFAKL